MGSSAHFNSSSLLPCELRPRSPMILSPWKHSQTCSLSRNRSFVRFSAGKLEASWIQLDGSSDEDGYGGWSVHNVDAPNRNVLPRLVLTGIGTSLVAILLAAVAYCSYSRKCFTLRLSAPFGIFHGFLAPGISKGTTEVTESDTPSILEVPVESTEDNKSGGLKQENKVHENKRIVVTVPADPTQLEALNALKKLKIIEYDAGADDLCTKREYARWLVKANSMLERRAKHRIIPMSLIPGSVVLAFDDVDIDDPDFWCIQALGEAGIISSRISSSKFSSLSDMAKSNDERFYFFPDNLVTRIDLLNWRALLEYSNFSELKEKTSQTKLHLLDLSASKLDAYPQLLMDLMSGDGSIARRTFGNTRRLQPEKPITKVQAAVALSSGRMAEAMRSELSRLETEELSRLSEMEEIRVDLIQRGATKHLEEKLREVKKLAHQAERYLEGALFDLEIERVVEEERFTDFMKEKADLECQRQMLFNFKKGVDKMCEKLAREEVVFMDKKRKVTTILKDLCEERDAVSEAKSVLEIEKEALQILR
ncbi:hypothetical protein KSP40_PGU010782 [Platanthera guangdongensis]|uniref:SLH domain-containing protein n=1 Tax=Platanthera guangdongensis TaxID=2320717 RepID=A0ABR2LXN5_9ASPA